MNIHPPYKARQAALCHTYLASCQHCRSKRHTPASSSNALAASVFPQPSVSQQFICIYRRAENRHRPPAALPA